MSPCDGSFHQFARLPVELRLIIWRECLPHRILEMDYPQPNYVFASDDPAPCGLGRTTTLNGLTPVITRVCRESRAVALETARQLPSYHVMPDEVQWGSSTSTCPWTDFTRDSDHLNWTPDYEVEWGCAGNALLCLAWCAANLSRGGSLMLDSFAYLSYEGLSTSERIDILRQLPSWVVVTQTVVVHADISTGAKTGLFGLLDDAPVQLVDVYDEARVNAYFDLVEECDRMGHVDTPQRKESPEFHKELLEAAITRSFGVGTVLPTMKPAIMFRLCPEACNHRGEHSEEYRRQRAQARRQKTQDRVRAQQRELGLISAET